MEEMERLNNAVATREGELGQEEGAVGEEVQALEKRLAVIEGNANKLKAERPELLEGLEGDWLSRYERIIQHVGDYALVKIERGVCMGCHMTLPPQLIHNSKKRDSITVCSFCGRILFDG
jgi:predicted  nucleic acid-binding Zn-ribbon protein